MLTAEVISLVKKSLMLLAALLFCAASHLRPCVDCEIDGAGTVPGCSLRAAARAERAARAAAEEILPGPAALPGVNRHLRLRLRRAEGDARLLSDALLRATEGVAVRDEVRVDGKRLGWVADGAALREALAEYIGNTLPTWAEGGVLTRELTIRTLYTRSRPLTATRDMLLLITGAAPVFYYDAAGRYARA